MSMTSQDPAATARRPTRSQPAGAERVIDNLLDALDGLSEAPPRDESKAVIIEAAQRGIGPLRALVDSGVALPMIERAVWQRRGFPYVTLTVTSVAQKWLDKLPLSVCAARTVVPFDDGTTIPTVAVSNPSDIVVLDEMRTRLGPSVRFVVADAADIRRVVQSLEARTSTENLELEGLGEDRAHIVDIGDVDESEGEVAKLVSGLVIQAATALASDIHIEPSDKGMKVRFRIDGVLHHVATHPVSLTSGVVNRLKVLANLDVADRRRPQDGRFGVSMEDTRLDLRLVTVPTIWEVEGAVIRVLDQSQKVSALDGLGFSPWVLDSYMRLCEFRHGSVLATGPTGSGKTTTLYATLDRIATIDSKVLTIEDPVEIRFPDVTQVQVNAAAGLTFATALRSFLRADPDIMLVGEIRDIETALVGTEAALTGHLVLASLHANNAPASATRLLEMGIDPYLVASSLRGAVSQRLVRRLCEECREDDFFQPEMFAHLAHLVTMPKRIYRARDGGCGACNGIGYRGRTAVGEVVLVTPDLSAAIARSAPGRELTELAIAAGMVPIRDDGLVKVMQGETAMSEVARVVN